MAIVDRMLMLVLLSCFLILQPALSFAEIFTPPFLPRLPAAVQTRHDESGNAETSHQGHLRICQSNLDADLDVFPEEFTEEDLIPDPLEPINRLFFHFNDKLYFWAVKPIAIAYNRVLTEPARICVRNFFSNLDMPIRAVNCLLQGKIKGFGTEITRFLMNSTIGGLGLTDPAKKTFNIEMRDEDLGQTFGFFGLGPGIYINWPFLGPSSLRDTIGWLGDGFLDPLNYFVTPAKYNIAVKGFDNLNKVSLRLGEYESLKKAALEPYVSLRDAYHQNRQHQIKK